MKAENNLDIVFYTEGLPFCGDTDREGSLGGSETAVLSMGRALRRMGHQVRIFCHCPAPGEYDGVIYQDVRDWPLFAASDQADVLVACRHLNALAPVPSAGLVVTWQHDILLRQAIGAVHGVLWQIDKMLFVSEFHRRQWLEELGPTLGTPEDAAALEKMMAATRNGVDLEQLDNAIAGVGRDLDKVIYTSRPERGLEVLLTMWPKLRERFPNLKLSLCHYAHPEADQQPHMQQLLGDVQAFAAEHPEITLLPALSKEFLYREIASSRLMLYPSTFPEVSCISALEAMACGTPIITSEYCALKETVPQMVGGVLIPGDPRTEQYQQAYLQAVTDVLEDKERWQRLSEGGRAWVEARYQWGQIAQEWIDLFHAELAGRPRQKVVAQLMHQSDWLAAKQLGPKNAGIKLDWLDRPEEYAQIYEAEVKKGLNERMKFEVVRGGVRCQWFLEQLRVYEPARPESPGTRETGKPIRVLDWGCYDGTFLVAAALENPGLQGVGVEISESARKASEELAHQKEVADRVIFATPDMFTQEDEFQAVWLGEILEHVADPTEFLDQIENYVKPGGLIMGSVPLGPWESLSYAEGKPILHVRSFALRDLLDLIGGKSGCRITYQDGGQSPAGEALGWFLFRYIKEEGRPTGRFNYRRKRYTRPRETVTACMILGGEQAADTLHRCLKSVRPVVDQIQIAHSDCSPEALRIAEQYGAKLIPIEWPDSFEDARNLSIQGVKTDWILWIDADEYLVGAGHLQRYLRGNIYNGYIIRQHHHAIDAKFDPDLPVRLFRNRKGIRFYGVIHEHPEMALNQGVHPTVTLADVNIIHDGYVTETIRRRRFWRNLPLLLKDREKYPGRRLGQLFMLRDYVHLARYDWEKYGQITEKARHCLEAGIRLYREHFSELGDPLQTYAGPLYQTCLEMLGRGRPVELVLRMGDGKSLPFKGRFESAEELERIVQHRIRSQFPEGQRAEGFSFEAG